MPLYSSFKYSTKKYGASTLSALRFGLDVDWNGDGTFDGTSEGSKLTALTIERGRRYYIKNDGSGFEHVDVGKMDCILMNLDGRYDPYNTGSPLYPNVQPGQLTRMRVRTPAGNIYPLLAGTVDDIQAVEGRVKQARLTAQDGVKLLQGNVSVPVQAGIKADDGIAAILEDVAWPVSWGTDIETGADTRSFWWADGSGVDEIAALADAELGSWWVAADGKLTFRNRYSGVAPTATLSAGNFRFGGGKVPNPWEVVRNVVRVFTYPRTEKADVELWRWAEQPLIPAGESRTVFANFTYNSQPAPAESLTTPVAGTDFTANSQQDGSGTALTATFSVAVYSFGTSGKVVITNNGGVDGYATLVKVRGNAIVVDNSSYAESQNSASINLYKRKTFKLDVPWIQDNDVARGIAEYLVAFLAVPRPYVIGKLIDQADLQFNMDIGKVYTVDRSDLGINANYRVAWLRHKNVDRGLTMFETEVLLEPFIDLSDFWIFPATIGVSTVFGF